MAENVVYLIHYEELRNKDFLFNNIYYNLDSNYYATEDFSMEFYIYLASCGFITTSANIQNDFYLIPEMQFDYAVLDFENLIISKSISKLMKNNEYHFCINKNPILVLDALDSYHKDNWLIGKYKELVKDLFSQNINVNFKMLSIELYDKKTNALIAGEIGYKIGSTYTSLSGFSSKKKEYKNWGKLQMVLLGIYLKNNNYAFWNLGHPYMDYKLKLGAKVLDRLSFLKRWLRNI